MRIKTRKELFSKVSPSLWRSKRFIGLSSDRAKLLHLYYLTCRHQNSAGCYHLPEGYAVADLGWSLEEYRTERKALQAADLIAYDDDTEEVFVRGWYVHCPPQNSNHAAGIISRIAEIESDAIGEILEAEFTEANKGRWATKAKKMVAENPQTADGEDENRSPF
ncbi:MULTISPECIES: hypothetical protein [unclassified Mesorhizobium]|uniref:hypothetical protein n=1 Tax=unclassified Mesorhizobium TaxID=325217 RepID=UPI000FDA3065|nr:MULTISPECIES: hypothetical protein [unclassified Mesorhizobium]TGQ09007.1 hypothetical protein EN862_022510 [Mesorhizobium sp. M2E.F.Ca.ET.219.01.1.1]TGT69542.1 hypothetical protein EN809_024790 [Mesorhizobium sp. M2E.F.Ca.ET.166.01.1.1]TGW01873.1 hypothetical protein EN797_016280 [Mesorhizobium sp. M2E.F.Ca.ET.154.01.1.1]